ncbi:AMP-binding protein [Streptomyces erythrochromogenes]|uniref:AMP-binding protein n=1 Tax=Streptomyces erythrochromogenes TaxID=285574 RepID=UPI0037CCF6B2
MELSPSAHADSFCRDRLPPFALWPELHFDLTELQYPDRLNCAARLLDEAVAQHGPDRPCLLTPTERWTYGELQHRANQVAQVLTEDFGLRPGNRVLLRGPNNPWLVAAWFGVLKAGGVAVTTMPMLRAGELGELADISRPSVAVCDHRYADELEALCRPGAPEPAGPPGPADPAAAPAAAAATAAAALPVITYGGTGSADLTALCAAKDGRFDTVATAADDVALIAFTSGTTGRPKATLHFHRDVLANADTFSRHVLRPRPDDVFTGTPPLAFTFGLGGLVVFPLSVGAATLLIEQTTPLQLADLVADHGATVLFTAPTAYRAIMEAGAVDRLSGLRRCVSAGEPLPAAVWQEFHAATGLRIIDGIGATEMLHVFISAADEDIRPGATGRPVPGYRAAVVDEHGAPVPDGQPGLLAVTGPTGCRYLADPRQSSYVRNGWNITGDTYVRDADGYFWYVARSDDMIVSSGYNIAGPEVEKALLAHPHVEECAVVGAPDERRGMLVKAYVVLAAGVAADGATVRELQAHVKASIAPYKYPRAVEFVTELPRTGTGKLRRGALRERARTDARNAPPSPTEPEPSEPRQTESQRTESRPTEPPASAPPPASVPPSVLVERRVEWTDTDAAGHYHHSTVVRWVEAAEAVLLHRLGLSHLFGSTPRVHFEADYRARLWFGDTVRTELRVTKVGSASLHYAFTVRGAQGGEAAAGRMVIAHSAAHATGSTPWPDDVRDLLGAAGPQQPELLTTAEAPGGTPCASQS